jgi:ATP12 chaperone protein
MSDGSDGHPPDNPAAAVRRAMRPALRRRFYDKVGTAPEAGGYAVRLDGKPVRTPAGRVLAAPSAALAQALAAEWDAQRDLIDPARMPLTRLANSIIDGVGDRPDPVAAEIEKYLASDLVCYRAAAPSGLVERQARHWDPILAWAHEALGARLRAAPGVVHIAQDEDALARARGAIPREPQRHSPAQRSLRSHWRGGVFRSRKPGRRRTSTRTGTWSNGAATKSRSNAVLSASPNSTPRQRCCAFCSSGIEGHNPQAIAPHVSAPRRHDL